MMMYGGVPEVVKAVLSHAPLMARLIMPIMAPRIYASRARRVYGTPTPPRIQAATRLPAEVADEFGAEQATPDQTLGS